MSVVDSDPFTPITAEQWAELRARYPDAYMQRVAVAMRVASDVDACAALLRGEHVDPGRLDADGLQWARDRMLVRLDLPAIDLLEAA